MTCYPPPGMKTGVVESGMKQSCLVTSYFYFSLDHLFIYLLPQSFKFESEKIRTIEHMLRYIPRYKCLFTYFESYINIPLNTHPHHSIKDHLSKIPPAYNGALIYFYPQTFHMKTGSVIEYNSHIYFYPWFSV